METAVLLATPRRRRGLNDARTIGTGRAIDKRKESPRVIALRRTAYAGQESAASSLSGVFRVGAHGEALNPADTSRAEYR